MLPLPWTPLRPHKQQSALWRTRAQFVSVAAGRGSGKTELARRRVVRLLPVKKPWSDPMYFYALPTFSQARRVAWKYIKSLIPEEWLAKPPNETELVIETKFGSTLYVVGMDKPQRIEGNQWDGGVVDESCDQKPKMFDLTILPALSHRAGWCWRIGVPKRYGVGAADFKAFCKQAAECTDGSMAHFEWESEGVAPPAAIAWAKANLDERDYNEQYKARWETASGQMFYAFNDVLNVRDVTYNPQRSLIIGTDFNVNPMCWVIGQVAGSELYIIDEIVDRNTNTPATLTKLYNRYKMHASGFEFYGDASSRARKTSAPITDYMHIVNDKRFVRKVVQYPEANPRIPDRVACCNALLCNAAGVRRLFIHPRCKRLIADLSDRTWKDGALEPDDSGDLGHMSDALGYLIYAKFPMRLEMAGIEQVAVGGAF